MNEYQLIEGDCLTVLPTLPAASVQCCVTSPPYFGLRDYGMAGQIGLEPTIGEYVAKMTAVFREVWRVLKPNGVLFLNLGDSYSGSNKGVMGDGSIVGGPKQRTNHGTMQGAIQKNIAQTGLPPKNLIGIPWRVAFALQQPFYAGKIKQEIDRVWLAAMIDGEGCFYVHRRQAGQHAGEGYYRKSDTYSCAIEVANTHHSIVERCKQITGLGSIICQEKDRRQPLYRWTVRCDEAREIAREVYPHLIAKKQQCRIVCGMPNGGDQAIEAWEAMKLLHAGSETNVEFPEPESLYSPGYYLRSDIIWAKPNPMPESVTDRPTRSHEYIFLFAKQAKYYYDAEAIREQATYPDDDRKARAKLDNKEFQDARHARMNPHPDKQRGHSRRHDGFNDRWDNMTKAEQGAGMRNKRDVWTVAPATYADAHFATFPPDLIEPCILAGSAPGDTVLDPFSGSGTTAAVALKHHRKAIGLELNPAYIEMAHQRISKTQYMLPLEDLCQTT